MGGGRCGYCESKDCNGRCSRTALKHTIDRLRSLLAELEDGEKVMEQELDALVAAKRDLESTMIVAYDD